MAGSSCLSLCPAQAELAAEAAGGAAPDDEGSGDGGWELTNGDTASHHAGTAHWQ